MSPTPDDRRLLTEFTLDRRVLVEWTVLGTGMTLVSLFAFATVFAMGTGRTDVGFHVADVGSAVVGFVLVLVLIAVVVVVHEVIHAAVISYYGGDVSFGVGLARFALPYAYVTTTQRLERTQFVVVALAPLVVITLVGVPLAIVFDASVLLLPLAVNAGGAIGDLWMAGILLRYPPTVVVEDTITGLDVYGTADDERLPPPTSRGFLKRIVLGSVIGFGVLVFVGLAAVVLLDVLGVQSFTLGAPRSAWNVYSFAGGPDGFEASVNGIGVVATSLLIGTGYAVATAARTPPPDSR